MLRRTTRTSGSSIKPRCVIAGPASGAVSDGPTAGHTNIVAITQNVCMRIARGMYTVASVGLCVREAKHGHRSQAATPREGPAAASSHRHSPLAPPLGASRHNGAQAGVAAFQPLLHCCFTQSLLIVRGKRQAAGDSKTVRAHAGTVAMHGHRNQPTSVSVTASRAAGVGGLLGAHMRSGAARPGGTKVCVPERAQTAERLKRRKGTHLGYGFQFCTTSPAEEIDGFELVRIVSRVAEALVPKCKNTVNRRAGTSDWRCLRPSQNFAAPSWRGQLVRRLRHLAGPGLPSWAPARLNTLSYTIYRTVVSEIAT